MKYTTAFKIASISIEERQSHGFLFAKDAAREAALAAVGAETQIELIDRMANMLEQLSIRPFDDPHDEVWC